jgi:uncharacterized protein (DUF111 family)
VDLQLYIAGQMSGEMFIGALLDAFPDYEDAVIEAIDAACERYPVDCRLETVREGGLRGHRFIIEPFTRYFGHLEMSPGAERESWGALRTQVLATVLPGASARHALALLMLAARHHAARHDISLDCVTFPRSDAWQMLAQFVGAAVVIDCLGAAQWAAFASNRDPATPVGRAILAHLGALPDQDLIRPADSNRPILVSGLGFGGLPSAVADQHLRINCMERSGAGLGLGHESAGFSVRGISP